MIGSIGDSFGEPKNPTLPEVDRPPLRRKSQKNPRMLSSDSGSADALADWLRLRRDEPGLFLPVKKGKIAARRMTDQDVPIGG